MGRDGRTLGARLRLAMTAYAKAHGVASWDSYGQAEWIALASRAVGLDPETEPIMTQQNLSLVLNDKTSISEGVIAFAVLLGVEAAWLQYGIGPATYLDKMLGT